MGLEMNGGGRSGGGRGRRPAGGMPRAWWGSPRPPHSAPDEVLFDLPDGASFDDEPPIDLSLLAAPRPGGRPAADWEALVARLERAAEPELARRARAATGVLDFIPVLARSLRPALIAAAAALLLAVGLVPREVPLDAIEVAASASDPVAGQLLSDASDERAPENSDAAWIAQQRAPSATALAEAIGLADIGDVP
jgi:hypothetical protein